MRQGENFVANGSAASLFLLGRNSRGQWVAQDQSGRRGGLFVSQAAALKFAPVRERPEAGTRRQYPRRLRTRPLRGGLRLIFPGLPGFFRSDTPALRLTSRAFRTGSAGRKAQPSALLHSPHSGIPRASPPSRPSPPGRAAGAGFASTIRHPARPVARRAAGIGGPHARYVTRLAEAHPMPHSSECARRNDVRVSRAMPAMSRPRPRVVLAPRRARRRDRARARAAARRDRAAPAVGLRPASCRRPSSRCTTPSISHSIPRP